MKDGRTRAREFARLFAAPLVLMTAAYVGCDSDLPPAPAFRFKVAEAWPIQVSEDVVAEDRVLAVGEVAEGTVRVGDRAVIPGEAGEILVTVEAIRVGEDSETEAKQTSEGETATVELRGIGPGVERSGEEVVGLPRAE